MKASAPVLLAVDEDPQSLSTIDRELTDRYARSYRVVCVASAEQARAELEAAATAGDEVALVLAPELLSGTSGSEFLGGVRALHPQAQRGLLIEWRSWGDGRTGKVLFAGHGPAADRELRDQALALT